MTFQLMAAIATYLAIGAFATYSLYKEDIAKIPMIWKKESKIKALGYMGFLFVMFLFGIFAFWPFGLMIWGALRYDDLSKKYKD